MKKKIVGVFVCMLLIATLFSMNGIVSSFISDTNRVIFQEIDETEDKILIVDKVIGDRHVKYWEHVIDGIFVRIEELKIATLPSKQLRKAMNYTLNQWKA